MLQYDIKDFIKYTAIDRKLAGKANTQMESELAGS